MASNRELLGCHVLYTKWLYTTSEVRCKPTQDTYAAFVKNLLLAFVEVDKYQPRVGMSAFNT